MGVVETSGHIHEHIDGVLHVYVKPGDLTRTMALESLDVMENHKRQYGELLVCINPNDAMPPKSEERKLSTTKFNEIVDGMAMLNTSIFVRLILRLTLAHDSPNFPIKIFSTEQKAIVWLDSLKKKSAGVV